MALTRQTMTDEQRNSVTIEYLNAFDKAGVTSDGGSVLDLFAEDAQVYFPKWGLADGREAIGRLFAEVGGTLKGIVHHYASFNWIFSGGDVVLCEGTSHGEHKDGTWRAGTDRRTEEPDAPTQNVGRASGAAAEDAVWIHLCDTRTPGA
jgi:ketosteroid isomerase-like protein